jgi:hypothetical protein
MSKHFSLDDLTWRDVGNGWKFASVTLSRGETTDNVVSTKKLIYGPASVEFWQAPDGGIREVVNE